MNEPKRTQGLEGLVMAGLGVLVFSFSLPLTRVAVPELGGTFVGLGRALLATVFAGVVLIARGERLPARQHWGPLLLTALGVVFGFPIFTSMALQSVPAIHGVVFVGLLPAATAALGVVRAKEPTKPLFWFAVLLGVVGIVVFALVEGAGQLQTEDLYLLLAVALGALGYTEGGLLARQLEGWRVISWALVFSAPFLLVPVLFALPARFEGVSFAAWLSFFYLGAFSMYLGFFAWYRGMALVGVAAASQVQLLQPLLSLLWAALLLHETLHWQSIFAALVVLVSVVLSRKARV